jgi:O-antigen ligase
LRAGNWDALTSYRSELYRSGERIFAAHPLLGSGPATFPMLTAPAVQGVPPAPFAVSGQGAFYSAHSMPINLAAETGIAGALAWIVMWLLIPAAALFRTKLQNKWLWLAVLMIGVGTLLDTFWLAAGMATFSVLIMWMTCAESNSEIEPARRS